MEYKAGDYDVIVIGGGHAGCEAGLAAARMGCRTLIFSINLDGIALMPCNPSIGGPGKGHLVREVDALGGEIGINIDKTFIQVRRLNTGKGPAVRALRAQADKKEYQNEMLLTLLQQENLDIKQAMIEKILVKGDRVTGVVTRTGAVFTARAIIVTTGTYLRGRIIIGEIAYESGPHGQFPSVGLAASLAELGLELGRYKTGTPARVNRRTVDFSKMIEQPGDREGWNFSFMHDKIQREQISCWLTYTNLKTHEIILNNLDRAPMYSGFIKGIGPRYCPSIEDKVVRFKGKEGHQVFLEPEGRRTNELYVQGMSTSLPEEIQIQIMRTVKGLENVEIIRPAYAIEYDYIKGDQLQLTLETKNIKGLFTAGQINGSSGYEEAAAQGILAGINAALQIQNKEPLTLKRSDGYIGVLIDDLITKENWEPYRVMTARAEYRLLLREDNADLRLTEIGRKVGTVSDERWERFETRLKEIEKEREWLRQTMVSARDKEIQAWLRSIGSTELKQNCSLWELIRRPEVALNQLVQRLGREDSVLPGILEEVETEIKYEGYIKKQMEQVERFLKLEGKKIPPGFNFEEVPGLSNEGKQKLLRVKPETMGQAGRIGGVSPADLSVLLVYLEHRKRSSKQLN
ncbi:MAG: tRNA uridine-5-carboxymethylaminomethyl(34) synthesis enzyme MnmG [Syntrophomonadaceae bacterium]|nr:tRNA uridine-5-carboxymethylaminomethyl(34) synthesis enzyme MnmG [Syntrophomonadaceae bacterium]